MSNGDQLRRLPGLRESQIARLNKWLIFILGIGVVLTILWVLLKVTDNWWCFAVGYGVAAVASYAVRLFSILPALPAWFRLRVSRDDRQAELVRVLLTEGPTNVDNPTSPSPLQPGDTHSQGLQQQQPSMIAHVEVDCLDMAGNPAGTESGILNLPPGANPQHFVTIECIMLPGDLMYVEVHWMESGWPVWYGQLV